MQNYPKIFDNHFRKLDSFIPVIMLVYVILTYGLNEIWIEDKMMIVQNLCKIVRNLRKTTQWFSSFALF